MKRRQVLGAAAGLAAGWPGARVLAQAAAGWNKAAFESRQLADVVRQLGGTGMPVPSTEVRLEAPEIAENGSFVRLSVSASLAGVSQLALFVARNPTPLVAVFDLAPGTDAALTTQIKMAETGPVVALARVGDRYVQASREVQVTLGGCGT